MKKKTMTIVLVVALAAFALYWFVLRKKDTANAATSTPATGDDTSATPITSTLTVAGIIDSLNLSSEAAAKVKAYASNAKTSVAAKDDWGRDIIAKASENGLSTTQQCVIEALFIAYANKKEIDYATYKEAVAKVKAL